MQRHLLRGSLLASVVALGAITTFLPGRGQERPAAAPENGGSPVGSPERDALQMIKEGRQTFRYDTFGDEAFWGDALKLHQAIAGEKLGGVGPGVSPKTALEVGLKVDMEALPQRLGPTRSNRSR